MDRLLELFRDVDDFCQIFVSVWQQQLLHVVKSNYNGSEG